MSARDDRRLVKLVRDDVEKFCGGDMVVRYEQMSEDEFIGALRSKLVEEAVEYVLNPSPEELADVVETVEALRMHDLRVGTASLDRARQRKRNAKGGFGARLGMYLHIAAEHR